MFSMVLKRKFFEISDGKLNESVLEITVSIHHGDLEILSVFQVKNGAKLKLSWGWEELECLYNTEDLVLDAIGYFMEMDSKLFQEIPGTDLRLMKCA